MFNGILEYSEESPTGLVWASDKEIREGVFAPRKGTPAGSFDGMYYRVGFNGTDGEWHREKCHRIVWQLFNGSIPKGMFIDHFDQDKTNNRIENLRLVEPAVNSRNSKLNSKNQTGVAGVTYHEEVRGEFTYCKYFARIMWEGKTKTKTFSVEKYGKEVAFELACKWRKQMLDDANKQGAGFTLHHGKSS